MPSQPIELVRFQGLQPSDQAVVRAIEVSEQQIEYAGTIDRAIQACEADGTDEVVGLAIRTGSQIAGFMLIKRRGKSPEWAEPSAVVITAMRIDRAHQGKGLGSSALLTLSQWVATHWSDATSLTLAVDEDNLTGIRAYLKAGFQDRGDRVQGRIGWVRYMSKAL